MKINWQLISRVLVGILLAIMSYFGKVAVGQLLEIQRDLSSIKLELVKIQSSMLDKEAVRDIVRVELYERGIK
jgi:hypothetical protein